MAATIVSEMTDIVTNTRLKIKHDDDLLELFSSNGTASFNLQWFTVKELNTLIVSLESYIDKRDKN